MGRMNAGPQTQVDEIAPDIFRMSTWVPDITEHGFTFNQFLLTGDEPMLFHTGQRQLFPLVSAAVNRVVPLEKLRWISFGHLEADECGAMNLFLDAAPNAEVIQGPLACMLSLIDMCDRPPVAANVESGAVHDIGGHRLRFIPTPHVPHNWEAGLWFDETTSTLLAGDLLTHVGKCPAHRIRLRGTGVGSRGGFPRHRAEHKPRADAGAARRNAAHYAGAHARLVLLWRRRRAAAGAGRRIRRDGGHWMTARWILAVVLALAGVLTGCQSSTPGTPVTSPKSPTEPSFPTSRPTRPTAAPPKTLTPAPPTSTAGAPGAEVLSPQNGYVFIETKSGKTRCQLSTAEVGCEAQFTNSPVLNGQPANGVRVTETGDVSWVIGNLGDIPAVTLDYRTYSAVGWTIEAREDGTRFTNDRTGHGMFVAVEGVQAF
jgi:hypothetical protein